MFVTCNSSDIQTWMVASFSVSARFMAKMWVGFGLNPGKRFFLEVSFWSQQKDNGLF